ncbi:MAG: peptidase S53 [Burkholderiaceae bacterium]|nr:MAG: peptidase S53 [Burkholderiaceae bacterium]
MASTSAVVYNPAQIRAAYGLPPLPASWSGLSASQLADYGAGQTIYVLDAYAYSNALSDLNAFSARFGLPSCRSVPAGTGTPGLLAAPAAQGCDFMQAYPDASGNLLATAPAYNAGWAGETALDVQWAHAIAPLARIVLLSARDANTNSLAGGVMAANRMGPGVLSMSFGAAEGSWTAQMESLWSHPGITYVASTGDSGTQVNWPAVSPKVLAVGGTTLSYSGSGSRTEVAWSGAGGGISAYTALPAYQAGLSIAGVQTAPRRTTSDVSFNADPYSGQYTAFTAPGGSTTWGAYAGTSIAAPQWAGLLAVANAKRIAKGQPHLGQWHTSLYTQLARATADYSATFLDVASGSNGACAYCRSAKGLDLATGWGTPHAAPLLSWLSTGSSGAVPPLPAAALPGGTAGSAYAWTWPATDANGAALSYANSGQPTGLAVSAAGRLTWGNPVAGSYTFGMTVTGAGGLKSSQTVTLVIAPPAAAQLSGGAWTLKTAQPFSQALAYKSASTPAFSLVGAPAGLQVSGNGVLNWSSPVTGQHSFSVKLSNAQGSTSAAVTLRVAPMTAPKLTSASTWSATAGSAWTQTLSATNPNVGTLAFSLSGAPAGLTVSGSNVMWNAPVAGSYAFTVAVKDDLGFSSTQSVVLKVSSVNRAPVMPSGSMSVPSNYTIQIAAAGYDPDGDAITYSLSGAPSGMRIQAATGLITWTKTVKGSYTVTLIGTDSRGGKGQGSLKISVN